FDVLDAVLDRALPFLRRIDREALPAHVADRLGPSGVAFYRPLSRAGHLVEELRQLIDLDAIAEGLVINPELLIVLPALVCVIRDPEAHERCRIVGKAPIGTEEQARAFARLAEVLDDDSA